MEFALPSGMAGLRSRMGDIVSGMEQAVPYAAALLSERGGLNIRVDSREERIEELPRTAGTVLTAYDGRTLHEAALGSFDLGAVRTCCRDPGAIPLTHRRGHRRARDRPGTGTQR